MSNSKYALFDWDNTVRNGYTLYSWVDYLCANSIIKSPLQFELNKIKNKYKKRIITHDHYASIACSKYAKALTGMHIEKINNAVLKYISYDKKFLFNNIVALFDFLYEKGINIIVISGAPLIVLQNYKEMFHFEHIYAFKEKILNDVFTGDVEYNFGFDKEKKVLEIADKYGSYPYIAFGDSESDIPMLNYARYAFYIEKEIINRNYINVDPNNYNDVLSKIKQICY